MNIDLLGNEIKTGDILLELGGGGCRTISDEVPTIQIYFMNLWEMPEGFDGHGYNYTKIGEKYKFAWASVGQSIKIDMSVMPEGFEYSFYHGMDKIMSTIKNGSIIELIENSNWEKYKITKEQVEKYERLLKGLKINEQI